METYDYYFDKYGIGIHPVSRKNKSKIYITDSTAIFYKVDAIENGTD